MKTTGNLLIVALFFATFSRAQIFLPVGTTGHNLDAIAENTTAASTTGGSLDGSNNAMYSVAYGTNYPGSTGLPNSGVIASGTRTYQLQTYTLNNVLYLTTLQADSLVLNTPASYGALSLLAFATEGNGSMDVTVRFTDNSTQVFSNITVGDWFQTGTTVISGFDRVSRTSGTPNFQTTQPKMFSFDLLLNCVNRSKSVSNVKIQNTLTNTSRICVMALSASSVPTFTAITSQVSCSTATDGSATFTTGGGIAPYTYTTASSPVQFGASPANLPTGVYSYTAQDAAACPVFGTFTITLSNAPQPALVVSASAATVCAGSAVTVAATGAVTYSWSNSSMGSSFTVAPQVTGTYSVIGTSNVNCLRTGSILITVNPLPVPSITGLPPSICVNSPTVNFSVSPQGGNLTGPGLSGTIFDPSGLVPGTYSISYTYTDQNVCSAGTSAVIIVNAVPQISFSIVPGAYCINGAAVTLSGLPLGGSFIGTGVSGSAFSPSVAGTGTTAITYSYTDGNNCSAGSTASVVVNPLPQVTFTMSKTSFCKTSPSVPLNALPSTGAYSGAGVSGSFFNPGQAGTGQHVIVYTYSNLNNCTTQSSVTVKVSDCTALSEQTMVQCLVYPNPNNGTFVISSPAEAELGIYDALGRMVMKVSLNAGNNHSCVLNAFSPGIYFVRDHSGTGVSQKIIIGQ
jgi:hypothetical protein